MIFGKRTLQKLQQMIRWFDSFTQKNGSPPSLAVWDYIVPMRQESDWEESDGVYTTTAKKLFFTVDGYDTVFDDVIEEIYSPLEEKEPAGFPGFRFWAIYRGRWENFSSIDAPSLSGTLKTALSAGYDKSATVTATLPNSTETKDFTVYSYPGIAVKSVAINKGVRIMFDPLSGKWYFDKLDC